jgi:hypothetical protein
MGSRRNRIRSSSSFADKFSSESRPSNFRQGEQTLGRHNEVSCTRAIENGPGVALVGDASGRHVIRSIKNVFTRLLGEPFTASSRRSCQASPGRATIKSSSGMKMKIAGKLNSMSESLNAMNEESFRS